jgi:hypothetical protein
MPSAFPEDPSTNRKSLGEQVTELESVLQEAMELLGSIIATTTVPGNVKTLKEAPYGSSWLSIFEMWKKGHEGIEKRYEEIRNGQ